LLPTNNELGSTDRYYTTNVLRCQQACLLRSAMPKSIGPKSLRATTPKLAEWLEQNVPEGPAVSALPASHRRRLRTINMLERLNKELKRRTRVAGLFSNEASALRLVSAVAMENSEEWETGGKYLTREPD
jgi:transposase-like protein